MQATNTIKFIREEEVLRGHTVTYVNFVCDYRPLKSEPYRVRLTVVGNRLEYPDDASSPKASILESKLIFNSTISDTNRGARLMSCEMKYFFL